MKVVNLRTKVVGDIDDLKDLFYMTAIDCESALDGLQVHPVPALRTSEVFSRLFDLLNLQKERARGRR